MTTLRIFGPTLNEQDTFIDAEITSVTLDGDVTLAETDGDREWTMQMERINELRDSYKAAKHSNITHPNHDVWGRLSGVHDDVATEPFSSSDIDVDGKLQEIFVTVMTVMVDRL